MEVLVLLIVFVALLVVGVPVAFCIGLATLATMLVTIDLGPAVTTLAQRMAGGMNSFALLAIPLFILSGQLMGQGGIATRLIRFGKAMVGMLPGGLALVNIVSCSLFGAISGSAVAATSAVGGFMAPEMNKNGYKKEFSAAITATASTTGLLIPPSNILIVYAVASGGVSISALFLAGYLPGIMIALALMACCVLLSRKLELPRGQLVSGNEFIQAAFAALPSLLLIVIVMGGIIGGVFTATEAGAIAVLYSLILSVVVYREVPLSQLPEIFIRAVETTAIVMFLVGTSTALSWILAYQDVPSGVAEILLNISDNPLILLLIINLALLMVGTFMDMTPAVLIFTPIFLPVAEQLGMSPLHFGIMMIMNLSIGLCTPPVGSVLFVSCAVGETRMSDIIRPLMPLYAAMFVTLLLITYVPAFSEALPRALGLYE